MIPSTIERNIIMMITNFNRWAFVDYFRKYGEWKKDSIFTKIADLVDSDVRPNVGKEDDDYIKELIQKFDYYKPIQQVCIDVVDVFRRTGVEEENIVLFTSAFMHDVTERDLAWERQHTKGTSHRVLLVNGATGETKTY